MFNMFKHEDSVIFDPIWCSVIGSDISKSTGAPKKRFLEEYERDLCYRRCAKKIIDEDLIYGVTNANYAKRPDAMKITAVIYQLMYGDKEADYAKLLSLFGKEYASTADVVSGLYRRMADPTAKLPFKYIKDTWGSDLGNVAVFAIYLLASPESYLPQNRKSFERLSEVFSQINSTRKNTSPMSDQQKVLMKYGISIQKNFSDFETAAMQGSRTRTIPVENEDGTCTQDTIFSYSDYGVHCHSELLSGLAMLDAGVSNCSNYDKTITKQKFLDAQKAVAKSLNFTKEMDGKVKFGDKEEAEAAKKREEEREQMIQEAIKHRLEKAERVKAAQVRAHLTALERQRVLEQTQPETVDLGEQAAGVTETVLDVVLDEPADTAVAEPVLDAEVSQEDITAERPDPELTEKGSKVPDQSVTVEDILEDIELDDDTDLEVGTNPSKILDTSDMLDVELEEAVGVEIDAQRKPSFEPRVVRNENYTEQTVKPVKVKPQIRSSRDISIFDDEE